MDFPRVLLGSIDEFRFGTRIANADTGLEESSRTLRTRRLDVPDRSEAENNADGVDGHPSSFLVHSFRLTVGQSRARTLDTDILT
jgi:hypothetical protein